MVERLVYTEAAESSNPSLPKKGKKEGKKRPKKKREESKRLGSSGGRVPG